ncbi:MAG: GntR family transcriptional regulator [Phycisphaeraceae bacterium]
MPAKYAQFAEMLETRIRRGDYALREMPTEQGLANEIGVSRMTARRAMLELVDRGVIVRKPYGRITVNPDRFKSRTLRLALLTPSHPASQYQKWSHSTERVAYAAKALVQAVNYAHWDDPIIGRSLSSFDGVFIVATSEPMPARVRTMLSKAGNVVALDSDWTDMAVPSIRMMRPEFVHQLGDHLRKLGHTSIDCLNAQPGRGIIDDLIEQWSLWKSLNHVQGKIINEPVEPHTLSVTGAYHTMKRVLKEGRFNATCVLCLTSAVATGAIRALHESGRVTGRDVSVACIDSNNNTTAYETPSRTCLITPMPDKFVGIAVRWFYDGKGQWKHPMLLEPASAELFEGESTVAVAPDEP